jgi:hypothetical protein
MNSEFIYSFLGKQNNCSEKYRLYFFKFKYWYESDPVIKFNIPI